MEPAALRYTLSHEWIEPAGDVRRVGISEHAQQMLGDIVYVELPKAGAKVKQNDEIATVESPKAAAAIYAPMSGEIAEVNAALDGDPAAINREPYGAGWLVKIRVADDGEAAGLMNQKDYLKSVEEH